MDESMTANLREPFPPEQIGKLPRVTCRDCRDAPGKVCSKHQKGRCDVCGMFGTNAHIHLDYVGHAAVTDRLLKVDPAWTWEPMALDADGGPLVRIKNRQAVLWIRMTVGGVTRPGVGVAPDTKDEVDKELISDAIRNSAMRFGVALDLWSKSDLAGGGLDDMEPRNNDKVQTIQESDRKAAAAKEAIDALMERVEALPAGIDETFRFWKADQRFPWPWPRAAVEAMNAKVDELEAARPYEMPDPPGDGVETCVACGKPFKKSGQDARSSSDEKYHVSCEPM